MKKNIFIFCVFLIYYQPCFAENTEAIKNTTIFVKLIDKDLSNKEVPMINLVISSYPFGGNEFFNSKDLSFEQVAAKEGNIFNISSVSDIIYMNISYNGKRIPGGLYYWIDNIYILKAGSKLSVVLDKEGIFFSGKGAEIPNVQSQIIKNSYRISESDLKLLNGKEYLRYFQKLDKSLDSALVAQLNVIQENKVVLGDEYVKLLIANCYGYRYYTQMREYDFFSMQDRVFFKNYKKYYNDRYKRLDLPKFTNKVLDASPMFTNYLIEKLNTIERTGHEEYGPRLPDSCIRNILQGISSNYNGILKDKLLTLFALRTSKNENAIPFFDEILNNVKTKKYNDLLVKKIKVKQNAIPFKDFVLEDTSGNRYNLGSFKNKVVLLDFWFTGCENCMVLNDAMKPIIKHFINNPQIQFVSISIDKSKEKWLKSVKDGKYTHQEGLNLYTNGEGSNHDLIRYYNVTNYPTVFVIKNGIMFSSLPPRPSGLILPGQEFSVNGTRLIELLEKALKL